MVSCNLIGRQANQMFIIASTIAYALRHGLEYHIAPHTLNDSVWKPMFTHLENTNWNPRLPEKFHQEQSHSYEEIPYKEGELEGYNLRLVGYFQSLKYFEDYLPEVRKAFGFDYTVKKKYTVAVHIRRGDYLNFPSKHPCVTKEYLRKAMDKISSIYKANWRFKFFSDDTGWVKQFCEETFLMGSEDGLVEISEGKTDLQDFQEMLECRHFIISNSTFSLMAAILSENTNKIVITPDESNWFGTGNSHLNVCDLIPQDFIRIKY